VSKKAKPSNNASEAATTFVTLVDHFRYQEGPQPKAMLLTNFTFWAGAGFSKSWDKDAPVADKLFTLDAGNLKELADPMVLSRMFGLNGEEIKLDDVRQIVYQLDMYERYSDVCSRYIDPQNINVIRAGLRAAVVRSYDKLARLNYFDSKAQKFPLALPSSQQRSILNFFDYIHRCVDGSGGFIEGIRCHFVTTNYDYVIETTDPSSLSFGVSRMRGRDCIARRNPMRPNR
jgi:hypothetical protein